MTPDLRCECGARREAIEGYRFGDPEPHYYPGMLLERCRCPHCVGCGRRADDEGRCPTMDCWHYGLLVL